MILIDNTVLSNFAIIHHPEFIQQAFVEAVITTEQVFRELEIGMKLGRLPLCDWTWLQRITLTDVEKTQFRQFATSLGEGEASCLAVAIHRHYNFATDDKDARQWALRFSIPHTGTLGILGALIKQGRITLPEGNVWLQQMTATGYRSPLAKLDKLV